MINWWLASYLILQIVGLAAATFDKDAENPIYHYIGAIFTFTLLYMGGAFDGLIQ